MMNGEMLIAANDVLFSVKEKVGIIDGVIKKVMEEGAIAFVKRDNKFINKW